VPDWGVSRRIERDSIRRSLSKELNLGRDTVKVIGSCVDSLSLRSYGEYSKSTRQDMSARE
jgi:hypothetical protein